MFDFLLNLVESFLPESIFVSSSVSSAAQSCLTLYDSMDCRIQGFLAHHQHPEHAQTCVHQLSDTCLCFLICCLSLS